MSRDLAIEAAHQKLADALGCTVADLGPLVDVRDLTALRRIIRTVRRDLASAQSRRMRPVVAAARRMPAKLTATIAERQFGPELCAAAISALDGDLAADIASHLSTPFMADITLAADPEAGARLAPDLPREATVGIATELIARGEFIAVSEFVAPIGPDLVAEVLRSITDDEAVVRIAVYVEDPSVLDPIVEQMSDAQLTRVVHAVRTAELWPEGLNLMGHLTTPQMARLGKISDELDDDTYAEAAAAAHTFGSWPALFSLLDHVTTTSLGRFAATPSLADPEVMRGLITSARDHGMLARLAPMLPLAPRSTLAAVMKAVADWGTDDPDALADLAVLVDHVEEDVLAELLRIATDDELWPTVIALIRTAEEPLLRRVVTLPGLADAIVPAFHDAAEASVTAELAAVLRERLQTDDDPQAAALLDHLGLGGQ